MTQEFVTLPREFVERALEALKYEKDANNPLDWHHDKTMNALRAALEQPQYHVPDVGNMAQAGWKLVPMEPTIRQMAAMGPAIRACYDMDGISGNVVDVYRAMLAAAPQPPVVGQSDNDTVPVPRSLLGAACAAINRKQDAPKLLEQLRRYTTGDLSTPAAAPQQGEQEPIAEHELKDVRCECCGYMTHHREHMGCIRAAHTKRKQLTEEQIEKICPAFDDPMRCEMWKIGFKAANNIK